jgi:pimeloyl-ACP methyl ester carboxylesterase
MPEIPEWASLRLAPERAVPTILASILALSARPETEAGDIGLVGFSFGAPQALVAASDPSVAGHLSGVFGFGGYRDLAETLRFQMTGHFRWQGEDLYLRPDPYGRWVVAGNLLTAVPEYSDAEDVSAALLELATIAGDRRVEAWDASFDPVKESLRARIATPRRWLFDLFAPPSGRDPTPEEASSVVERMNEVARTAIPLLDPGPFLPRVTVPVRLMHGREDHLIPFVETLKLVREMEGRTDARATITGLFAHSEDSPVQSAVHRAQDGLVFLRALRSVLVLV